jgi:hypothetical protein
VQRTHGNATNGTASHFFNQGNPAVEFPHTSARLTKSAHAAMSEMLALLSIAFADCD